MAVPTLFALNLAARRAILRGRARRAAFLNPSALGRSLPAPRSVVDPDDDNGVLGRYGRLAGIGLQFGAAIVLFALVGNWLDGRLGTRPVLLVLGVLLGFAGGTISLIHQVRR